MVEKSVYLQPTISVYYLVDKDVFLQMSPETSWPDDWGDGDVTEGGNDF